MCYWFHVHILVSHICLKYVNWNWNKFNSAWSSYKLFKAANRKKDHRQQLGNHSLFPVLHKFNFKGHNKAYIKAMVRMWHLLFIKETSRWAQWIPIAICGIVSITITQFTFYRSITQTEYEVSQYSITQYNNSIAKWPCVEKFLFETILLILVSYYQIILMPAYFALLWTLH